MNEMLRQFSDKVRGKKIAVIGVGISNVPLIKFLLKYGAEICAYDKKDKEQLGAVYNELSELGVRFVLGDGYLDDIPENIIFKTPVFKVSNSTVEETMFISK